MFKTWLRLLGCVHSTSNDVDDFYAGNNQRMDNVQAWGGGAEKYSLIINDTETGTSTADPKQTTLPAP